MRDEFGMIRRDVLLTMVHFGDADGLRSNEFGFANTLIDPLGGTLIHVDNFCVPVQDNKGIVTLSEHRVQEAPLDEILEHNEDVVCWNQPTDREQFRACRWTPRWMYDLATKTFVVTKQVGTARPIEIDRYRGILDLSARYATDSWYNGIIGHFGNTTYRIHELIQGPNDTEHPLSLTEDPRLDPDELPNGYDDMYLLPE